MRINTRLSPHAQVQFRVPERRSLGTRLEASLGFHDVSHTHTTGVQLEDRNTVEVT